MALDEADADILATVAQAAPAPVNDLASSDATAAVQEHVPASSSAADSSSAAYMPHVNLHIPIEAAPEELHNGLREIARHHIRKAAIRFCEKSGHGWMAAGGARDPSSGKGKAGQWWWNVAFRREANLRPGQLKLETSSDSFASSATSGFVADPWLITISYNRPCEAFRGLGRILGVTRSITRPVASTEGSAIHHGLLDSTQTYTLVPRLATESLNATEEAQFETLGTMIDVSRNGVLNVSSVKYLCRKLALMGYNHLQLYTEDTYKIDGEPFFGYLRGGYTQEDLKEIDDYAFSLGIECVPCIQTLGHLGQVLQWPRFLALRDTTEVLLAELPETYVLLSKMIATASKPFRSKRIHLGQDETHGLGHGRYHSIFGQHNYKDPTRIFIEHLQRVTQICKELDLEPMIWSDMLFCLNAKNNSLLGYYDSAQPDAPDVQGIPPSCTLVYWDYYHLREEDYTARIESHKLLNGGKAPWMAAGSWTWSRFWTALPFTFATCRASQNACKRPESGVKNVFLTIWGDEGNEVDLYSSLPAWAYYADHGYTSEKEVDIPLLKAKFDGITGGNFDDFVVASRLDDPTPESQTMDERVHFSPNTSKWMLWEEPFYGFITPSLSLSPSQLDLESHYRALSVFLDSRLSSTPFNGSPPDSPETPPRSLLDHPLNARLRFPALIARALSMKARLRERLSEAYKRGDWDQLEVLAGRQGEDGSKSLLGDLRDTVKQLHDYHRQLWMSMYRPFGWEGLDLRYGGLNARLETMHLRIVKFLEHVRRQERQKEEGKNGGHRETTTTTKGAEAALRDLALRDDEDDEEGLAEGGIMLRPEDQQDNDEDGDGDGSDYVPRYDEAVTSLPELEVELHIAYPSADQLLDYHRVSRPTYC